MAQVRFITVAVKQSFYVGDVKELENLIDKGYAIVAAVPMGEAKIIYTLVLK